MRWKSDNAPKAVTCAFERGLLQICTYTCLAALQNVCKFVMKFAESAVEEGLSENLRPICTAACDRVKRAETYACSFCVLFSYVLLSCRLQVMVRASALLTF